jgi:hypothetical protein
MIETPSPLPAELLDGIETPLLVLSTDSAPVFLNAAAARLLGIHDRSSISTGLSVLAPLIRTAAGIGKSAVINGRVGAAVTLTRFGGVPFSAFVEAHELNTAPTPLKLLAIYDLTLAQMIRDENTLLRELKLPALKLLAEHQTKEDSSLSSDLLSTLNAAILCSEKFIPNHIRIVSDVRSSALVAIPPRQLLLMLLLFLNEAAEFARPTGTIKLRAEVPANNPSTPGAKVSFSVERGIDLSRDSTAYDRCVLALAAALNQPKVIERDSSKLDDFAARKEEQPGLLVPVSEGWQTAATLCSEFGAAIESRRLRADMAVIECWLGLAQSRR